VSVLGLRGARSDPIVAAKNLDDPSSNRSGRRLAELGAFILIHPIASREPIGFRPTISPSDRQSARHHHCRGLPHIQRGLGALSHPEILPRPRGGFVPYQAGRFVHGWQVRQEPKKKLASRRLIHSSGSISIPSCTRRTLSNSRRRCGADRCCSAAINPFRHGHA